jgi:nitrogen fixation/metabolism regulation signal transduction histidine kinase
MSGPASFRRILFVAMLLGAFVPAAIAIGGGTFLLGEIGNAAGTAGPWGVVAESGGELIDAARAAAPGDTVLLRLSEEHSALLSESVRRSNVFSLLLDRVGSLLPFVAIGLLAITSLLSAWAAGRFSERLARPVGEMVDWTERIARGDPLPPPERDRDSVAEFARLRGALRRMDGELLEARAREVESARVRAWSEMARRVAHELKNPLTPIRMSASALTRSGDAATREAADIILEETGRLEERARAFARYGRPAEGPAAEVDIEEMLRTLVRRETGTAEGDEELGLEIEGSLPRVMGHHDPLERAVLNLIVNAREAMAEQGGGRVVVRARAENSGVLIAVDDAGPGVPDDLIHRVWEAEFTTRSRGTGLGLAIVRQTVESHDGRVSARNLAEGGASFRIELPGRTA